MQTLLYWFGKAVVRCVQSLPIDFVARLGRSLGALACTVDRRHRNVAKANLRRCFPEKTEAEIETILREHFRRLGENYACAIKTSSVRFEDVLARCEIVGIEKLATPERSSFVGPYKEFTAQGTPGAAPSNRIVAIGHFGNFEIYALLARCLPGYKHATTYRGLNQPALNRLMEELRNNSGCLFFERRSGVRELMRALQAKGLLLGLLSDQHGGRNGVWGPFFGIECSTNPAPAVFALRYHSPLNTAICFRAGLGCWRIEVGDEIPITENGAPRSVEAIMGDVNRVFEAAIRRDPANWFWVHKRWKPRAARP